MANNNMPGELFSCRVGQQWLGIAVDQVLEVVTQQKVTPMPFAPPHVLGLMNLRGQIITEIDVRILTGLDVSGQQQEHIFVVIVRSNHGENVGLVVDEVGGVGAAELSAFEKTPDTLAAVWRRVGEGVLKDSGRVTVVVNITRLLELSLPVQRENQKEAPVLLQ